MEKRKKIIITIAFIIAVIVTPLIIGALDMLLPAEFNYAILVMYIAYVMGTAAGLVIIWIELWGE